MTEVLSSSNFPSVQEGETRQLFEGPPSPQGQDAPNFLQISQSLSVKSDFGAVVLIITPYCLRQHAKSA